jgi:penicillin-binding protein 2
MENYNATQFKKNLFYFIVGILFIILISRLYILQISRQDKFLEKSEQNSIRVRIEDPPRGLIFDRKGKLLVDNRPSYFVSIVPHETKQDSLKLISEIINIPKEEIRKKLTGKYPFSPVKIKRQVDFVALSLVEENRLDLPGVVYQTEPQRFYPTEIRASHVLGYIAEVTEDELHSYKKYYQLGDMVGKKGIEKQYEDVLKGEKGFEFVRVDALGREIEIIEDKSIPPKPGLNIYLYIDSEIQKTAENLMAGKKGAVVMLDAKTGGIIAIVSKPDYDPNVLTGVIQPDVWNKLIGDSNFPLYNRALQSTYPPGSTFKLITAIAAIEEKDVTPDWTVDCPGYLVFGKRVFKCSNRRGHGNVDVYSAIQYSCNVYFYQLGLKIGIEEWLKYAKLFQFGRKTEVDLYDEKVGFVPNRSFYEKRYPSGWKLGHMLNIAVGQGEVLATPLQMARFAMIIGNRGKYHNPRLLSYALNTQTGTKEYPDDKILSISNVSEKTLDIIRKGMLYAVEGGTGKGAVVHGIQVAGKTGTAQNPHGKDHAWFIGFAPYEDPQVAICVVVENGGSGGTVAAPIAGMLIEKYFYGEISPRFVKTKKIHATIDTTKAVIIDTTITGVE